MKNADIEKLTCVLAVMQSICSLEDRCEFERGRMTSISQHLSFAPGGSGPTQADTLFAKLDDAEQMHEERVKEYMMMLKRAQRILNSIESETMRTMVQMLYIDHMPSETVKLKLGMSDWGYRQAKKAIESADSMADVKWSERFAGE